MRERHWGRREPKEDSDCDVKRDKAESEREHKASFFEIEKDARAYRTTEKDHNAQCPSEEQQNMH